jgi:hypothetical protein
MYSYLHHESGDTQYSDGARPIRFDHFSNLRHGDVVIVRTFVLCVLGCKWTLYAGTIQKTSLRRPGNELPDHKKSCCGSLSLLLQRVLYGIVCLASIYKPLIGGKFRANFQWCQAIFCSFVD